MNNDLLFFEKLGKCWWNSNGIFKSLHELNKIRVNYINKYCLLNNKDVLDVGCGVGILSESLSFFGAKVTGLDISNKLICYAKLHSKMMGIKNINYKYITSLHNFEKIEKKRYDIIFCMELLEHISSPDLFIRIFYKLLKKNGILFLSTLNKTYISYLLSIIGAEYFFNIIPKGTHNYNMFIKLTCLKKWLNKNNFNIININGILYNPIIHYAKFSNSLDVNYFLVAKKR